MNILIYIIFYNLFLIKFINSKAIKDLFKSPEIDCRSYSSFLIDYLNSFELYLNSLDFLYKIDIKTNELIDKYSKFSSENDYFTGILIRINEENFVYYIINQNRIIRLINNYFNNGIYSEFKIDNLTFKDNSRLFAFKHDNEQYDLLLSSSAAYSNEIDFKESINETNQTIQIKIVSNNLSIEYNLLQALLNTDFDYFSSTDTELIFIENDLLIHWIKNEYYVHQIEPLICSNSNEFLLFLKMITFFTFILFILSFIFDYIDPFNHYNLDILINNLKSNEDNEQIKYCLDTKSLLENNKSIDSVKTIDSIVN